MTLRTESNNRDIQVFLVFVHKSLQLQKIQRDNFLMFVYTYLEIVLQQTPASSATLTALKCTFMLCMRVCERDTEWHTASLALQRPVVSTEQKVLKDSLKQRFKTIWAVKAGLQRERPGASPRWTFSWLSCCAVGACPARICRRSRCAVRGAWAAFHGGGSAESGGPWPTPGTWARKTGRTRPDTACCSGWPRSPGGQRGQHEWVWDLNFMSSQFKTYYPLGWGSGKCHGWLRSAYLYKSLISSEFLLQKSFS